jgi:hypothetical protein
VVRTACDEPLPLCPAFSTTLLHHPLTLACWEASQTCSICRQSVTPNVHTASLPPCSAGTTLRTGAQRWRTTTRASSVRPTLPSLEGSEVLAARQSHLHRQKFPRSRSTGSAPMLSYARLAHANGLVATRACRRPGVGPRSTSSRRHVHGPTSALYMSLTYLPCCQHLARPSDFSISRACRRPAVGPRVRSHLGHARARLPQRAALARAHRRGAHGAALWRQAPAARTPCGRDAARAPPLLLHKSFCGAQQQCERRARPTLGRRTDATQHPALFHSRAALKCASRRM